MTDHATLTTPSAPGAAGTVVDARRARPVVPPTPGRRGLGIGEVRLAGGFWGDLQETNARATFDHCLTWMDRLGWLANFDAVAAGSTERERPSSHAIASRSL